jgi:hypothetical protein
MKFVYHASTKTNLRVIKPKRVLYDKDGNPIGKYVFATHNIKYASMYLVKLGYFTLMNPSGHKPYIIIQSNSKKFISEDKGGAIYTLPDTFFSKTSQYGLEETERLSKKNVIPVEENTYKSSIEAMTRMGITIFFVDRKTFKILLDTKIDKKILHKLKPYPADNK